MNEPRMPGYQEPYPMGGSDPDPLPRQVIMTDGAELIEWVVDIIDNRDSDLKYSNAQGTVSKEIAKQILVGLDVYVIVRGFNTQPKYIHISEIIKEVDNG